MGVGRARLRAKDAHGSSSVPVSLELSPKGPASCIGIATETASSSCGFFVFLDRETMNPGFIRIFSSELAFSDNVAAHGRRKEGGLGKRGEEEEGRRR